jgi:NAD(P)-dependent dehydrogenase (short-subunit alcohol dehydrogenase family)
MAETFGKASTTDEVLAGVHLKYKRLLVRGVSSGLRVETARSLAAHGAQVVGTARDLNKAQVAAAANGGSFEVRLELASLWSVRACADGLLNKGEPFDLIIANAGVMATPFGRTEDGFEMPFGGTRQLLKERPLRSGLALSPLLKRSG